MEYVYELWLYTISFQNVIITSCQDPGILKHKKPYGHLSLKIHNVKFDITVPPDKMYVET